MIQGHARELCDGAAPDTLLILMPPELVFKGRGGAFEQELRFAGRCARDDESSHEMQKRLEAA